MKANHRYIETFLPARAAIVNLFSTANPLKRESLAISILYYPEIPHFLRLL